jgi:glycosyltransferase involved in cell wall biosynthesis
MKKPPISVLHFSNTTVRGGAEEHILTLLQGLDRKLFRLCLVCPQVLAEKLFPDLPADVELVPLCLDKPTQIAAALRLAQVLRRRQVDILHSHMFQASLLASPIGWLCRVPVIIETSHGREAWRHGWLKGHFVVDRWVGRSVDYYIAVSEASARYLTEEKGLPARKILVIRNGIDLTRFDPAHPAPMGIKRSIGFDDGDPLLLVVGRLEPQKGHHVLLEALPAVRQEFPQTRLVCIGDGALRDELEGKACSLGLEGAVRFLGYQSNVPDWLAAANVAVLPSFYEGLPITALECLAAGKPMVATSADGTAEVVVNEKTGLTVLPGNTELLTSAICRLLREPDLGKRLGAAGRRWVEEHFSIERQILKTQELYLRAWEESVKAENTEPSCHSQESRPAGRRGISHCLENTQSETSLPQGGSE